VLVAWVVVLVACSAGARAASSLRAPSAPTYVASKWRDGKVVARTVVSSTGGAPMEDVEGTLVFERIVGESWLPSFSEAAMSLSLLPAHDGVRVELDGKSAYVTPDELLARQAYDHGISLDDFGLTLGVDVPLIVAMAAERLGRSPVDVRDKATFRRIRTERFVPGRLPERPIDGESFDDGMATAWVLAAGRFLARGVSPDGRFRYLVNAATNQTLSGYDWPRHAGATYFLAQTAALARDRGERDAPSLGAAALRAATTLRTSALHRCGAHVCVGEGDPLEIGSAALSTIAFVEIATSGLDPSYGQNAQDLAELILSLQRPDGEFMHQVRRDGSPIDVQLPYFSGEAALALTRVHALTGDARYLDGAKKSVAYLVGPAWHFFGSRYYFAEEHWTCQAAGELWDRSPDRTALDFCLRWHAFNRSVQLHKEDCVLDCDGALGLGPLVTPRFTPVASRCEAGIATLASAKQAGVDPAEIKLLEGQIRRSLALLVRQQFHGQLTHLMANPDAILGGMPGSEVDWALRIDYAQHAGSAMMRWLALSAPPRNQPH
jgi:hypothetical protein